MDAEVRTRTGMPLVQAIKRFLFHWYVIICLGLILFYVLAIKEEMKHLKVSNTLPEKSLTLELNHRDDDENDVANLKNPIRDEIEVFPYRLILSLESDKLSAPEARKKCAGMNMTLISLDNESLVAKLKSLQTGYDLDWYWTSGRKLSLEQNDYKWANAKIVNSGLWPLSPNEEKPKRSTVSNS